MPHTRRPSLSLPLLALFLAAPLGAATAPEHPWCGTSRAGFQAQAAIHRDHQRRLERRAFSALRTEVETARVGDIAVLVDDGSMVVHPNTLDLDDLAVQYVPQKKGGFVVSPSGDLFDAGIGERIPLNDDDSREVALPKGFRFRFFGRVHTRMFVHSDGNLTFAAPDAASTPRSLDRLIGGPPRIAPLFADLDPSAATGEAGVYVLATRTKVVVTWLDLPEFGRTNRNTAQAVLHADGRIVFSFGRLDAAEAVVGVAPGGGGPVQLLDYTAGLPTGVIKTAVAERFAAQRSFDHLAVAKAFFREFADDYDHLVVFLDFPQSLDGAFAFQFNVKNEIRGIGDAIYDFTAEVGSRGRLRSFVQMGALSRYPPDPEGRALLTNTTLDVVAHETGHRWLASADFLDDGGERSDALLGRQRAHWSFCHDSLASVMEGNLFREDGGGRFTTIAATERYSPLDQYLMGLIPPSQVPPFYYVEPCLERETAPEIGVTLTGRRVDLAIERIVAAEGPRVPAANKAPKSFNMAFILVGEAGEFPSADSIAKVDRIRAAWGPYFAAATDGLGTVRTALKLKPKGRR